MLQTWSRSVGPDGRFTVGVVSLPDHFRFRQHGFRYENLTPGLTRPEVALLIGRGRAYKMACGIGRRRETLRPGRTTRFNQDTLSIHVAGL